MAKAEPIKLSGVVQELFYSKPTFSAGKIDIGSKVISFSLKGFCKVGEAISMAGIYEVHPKYGKQFSGIERIYSLPADPAGLAVWLSWHAPGVGPVRAQSLVETFGINLPKLCETDPAQVAIESKLPIEVIEGIATRWNEFASHVGIQTRLAGFGMTQRQVEQIVEKFKGSAVAILEEDAFMLLGEVDGVGFAKCDEIARKFGIKDADPRRVRAALQWVVRQAYHQEGHTAMSANIAQGEAIDLLEKADGVEGHNWGIESMAEQLVEARRMVVTTIGGSDYYSHPVAHQAEMFLDRYLRSAAEPNPWYREKEENGK